MTPRRYYLLNRLLEMRQQRSQLAGVWRWKQESITWPDLPLGFPARSQLMAAGYTTVRDLDGADCNELTGLGLTSRLAQAVLAAMEFWKMIASPLVGYTRADGAFAPTYDATLVALQSKSATFTTDTYEMGSRSTLRLTLSVGAVTGMLPTLDVQLQTSADGATNWQPLGQFGQKTTANTSERNVFPGADRYVRAVCTIGGTLPVFPMSLLGEAV